MAKQKNLSCDTQHWYTFQSMHIACICIIYACLDSPKISALSHCTVFSCRGFSLGLWPVKAGWVARKGCQNKQHWGIISKLPDAHMHFCIDEADMQSIVILPEFLWLLSISTLSALVRGWQWLQMLLIYTLLTAAVWCQFIPMLTSGAKSHCAYMLPCHSRQVHSFIGILHFCAAPVALCSSYFAFILELWGQAKAGWTPTW